ncbi:hypothetical protein WJX72_007046 [[Myrmecia] bisecta]|uniref:DNA 3'-5' helicase n=1 Tax=[Myrmecia] bisecta TaxID=41462 RepID=A0AAW1QS37_9CHLO
MPSDSAVALLLARPGDVDPSELHSPTDFTGLLEYLAPITQAAAAEDQLPGADDGRRAICAVNWQELPSQPDLEPANIYGAPVEMVKARVLQDLEYRWLENYPGLAAGLTAKGQRLVDPMMLGSMASFESAVAKAAALRGSSVLASWLPLQVLMSVAQLPEHFAPGLDESGQILKAGQIVRAIQKRLQARHATYNHWWTRHLEVLQVLEAVLWLVPSHVDPHSLLRSKRLFPGGILDSNCHLFVSVVTGVVEYQAYHPAEALNLVHAVYADYKNAGAEVKDAATAGELLARLAQRHHPQARATQAERAKRLRDWFRPDHSLPFDEEQHDAATLPMDKPALVIANAGAGKSTMLAGRVAHLMGELMAQGQPHTEEWARDSLRGKLAQLGLYLPYLSTLDSFCLRLARQYTHLLNKDRHIQVVDEQELRARMCTILADIVGCRAAQTNDGEANIASVAEAGVRRLMKHAGDHSASLAHGWSDAELGELAAGIAQDSEAGGSLRSLQLSAAHVGYGLRVLLAAIKEREELAVWELLDYALTILRRGAAAQKQEPRGEALPAEDRAALTVLESWEGKCFLVDEAQDMSRKQWELVCLLTERFQRLTMVGDPDQNIFGWRDACMEIMVHLFDEEYGGAAHMTLTRNYRSPQAVLDASFALISHNQEIEHKQGQGLGARKPMICMRRPGFGNPNPAVVFERFRSVLDEQRFICARILAHKHEWQVHCNRTGIDEAQRASRYKIAVLARNNKQLQSMAYVMRTEYRLSQDMAFSTEDEHEERLVTLSTVHAAKGTEADIVFLMGMTESAWSVRLRPDEPCYEQCMEEARRLAYVGITRTKRQLYCTYSERPCRFWVEAGGRR